MSVQINGHNIFARLWITNEEHSNETITTNVANPQNISWDFYTVLLANLYNDLNAGNVNMSEFIEKWRIYRRKISETQNHLVCEVPAEVNNIRDYVVSNNNKYIYTVIPIASNYVGDSITSNEIATKFYNYSLTDIVTKEVWLFCLNTEGGNISINENISVITNNTQFPIFSRGKCKYKSGQINALLGNINSNGIYSNDTIIDKDNLESFISNGNIKILKTKKGDLLLVETSGFSYSTNDEMGALPQTISFTWTEVEKSDNISLYDEIV